MELFFQTVVSSVRFNGTLKSLQNRVNPYRPRLSRLASRV